MVGRVLAKDELGVRFSLPAPSFILGKRVNSLVFVRDIVFCRCPHKMALNIEFHVKTVDKPVDFGHKRQ